MWKPEGRCGLLAVDVVGFGRPHTNMQVQIYLRDRLYEFIVGALRRSGVEFSRCYSEDRGDGLVAAIPPEIPTDRMIHPFADYLRAALRLHNQVSNEVGLLRLRVSVHSGEAWTDTHGLVGDSVIDLFRLLDAPAFKQVVDHTGAYLALITSDGIYDQVIRHAPGLIDPDDYAHLAIENKNFSGAGWIRLVGRDPSVGRSA